jgi:hypothetical protein
VSKNKKENNMNSCDSCLATCLATSIVYAKPVRDGIGNGLVAGLTSWLGHSITNVGFLHGFGFGAVAAAISYVAYPIINKQITNKPLAFGLSLTLGGAAGYGASVGLAALGFAAAPITLAGAALCTGVLLALNIGQLCIELKAMKFVKGSLKEAGVDLDEVMKNAAKKTDENPVVVS